MKNIWFEFISFLFLSSEHEQGHLTLYSRPQWALLCNKSALEGHESKMSHSDVVDFHDTLHVWTGGRATVTAYEWRRSIYKIFYSYNEPSAAFSAVTRHSCLSWTWDRACVPQWREAEGRTHADEWTPMERSIGNGHEGGFSQQSLAAPAHLSHVPAGTQRHMLLSCHID